MPWKRAGLLFAFERVQRAGEDAAERGLRMRVADQQRAVGAVERHGAAVAERDGAEQLLEIGQLDDADRHADEVAFAVGDLLGEEERPGAGRIVAHRRADEAVQAGIGLQRAKIVALAQVGRHRRAVARGIDRLPLGIDDDERVDLRQTADLVPEHLADIAARHHTRQLRAALNVLGGNLLDHAALDETDGLKRAVELLGEAERGVAQLAFGVSERPLAKVRHQKAGADDDTAEQERGADEKIA